jgi:N-acetylmuramoyl-L-alanine amidase
MRILRREGFTVIVSRTGNTSVAKLTKADVSDHELSVRGVLLLGPASPGWFDTPSRMPGALIEPLFMTDPFEGPIADSTKGQHVIAVGLARAVQQYFTRTASKE